MTENKNKNKNHLLLLDPKDTVTKMRQVLYNCTFKVGDNKIYLVQMNGHKEIFIMFSYQQHELEIITLEISTKNKLFTKVKPYFQYLEDFSPLLSFHAQNK